VPTKLIRDFSMFTASSSGRSSPSARCAIAVNSVCRFLGVLNRSLVSLDDTFPLYNYG
jgi:hypothetical protein